MKMNIKDIESITLIENKDCIVFNLSDGTRYTIGFNRVKHLELNKEN